MGPDSVPCGTPACTCSQGERVPRYRTQVSLSVMKLQIQGIIEDLAAKVDELFYSDRMLYSV